MTTNDIDAIRKLTAEATPGPWTAHPDGLVWGRVLGDPVSGSTDLRDAAFIAAARTHVPALCDEIEQLRAEREHMELNPTGTAEWLKNRVAELTAELEKVRAQRDRLVADLADAGNEVDLLTAELAKVRAQLTAANQSIRDRYEQITKLELHVAGLEKQCNEQMHQLAKESAR